MNYIPDQIEMDMRALLECQGGAGKESIGTDYVVYERMFKEDYLLGLVKELKKIEKVYDYNFISTQVERSDSTTVEGDYSSYHRIS